MVKDQRASYDDGLWSGDIFHLDFQHGCSAYFDVPYAGYLSTSASCAGVAAAAEEVANDEKKYLAAVDKV